MKPKQTAVEYLFELSKHRELEMYHWLTARAIEKEQIIDAWWEGYENLDPIADKQVGEDYYNNHFVDPNKKPDQV